MSSDYVHRQYAQSWIDMATKPGRDGRPTLVGVWERVNVKSLVWYLKKAFDATRLRRRGYCETDFPESVAAAGSKNSGTQQGAMSQTTDGKVELKRSRKAPRRSTTPGIDPATGPRILFSPRLIRNPKTGKEAIVTSPAQEAYWARTWRVSVDKVRLAPERLPAELIIRSNDSAERLPVDTEAGSAVNDSAPPTVADFHAFEAKGDVWLLRSELPDGSHRFNLGGIDKRVIEQSYTLAIRAGRSFLNSSDDPFMGWAKEVWIFHAKRADRPGVKDRRDRFTESIKVDVDGALVLCHSKSVYGFCAVSADLLGSLAAPAATTARSEAGSQGTPRTETASAIIAKGGRPPAHAIKGEMVRGLRGDGKQGPFARRSLKVSLKVLQRAENKGEATDATIENICYLARRKGLELKPDDLKKNTPPKAPET